MDYVVDWEKKPVAICGGGLLLRHRAKITVEPVQRFPDEVFPRNGVGAGKDHPLLVLLRVPMSSNIGRWAVSTGKK